MKRNEKNVTYLKLKCRKCLIFTVLAASLFCHNEKKAFQEILQILPDRLILSCIFVDDIVDRSLTVRMHTWNNENSLHLQPNNVCKQLVQRKFKVKETRRRETQRDSRQKKYPPRRVATCAKLARKRAVQRMRIRSKLVDKKTKQGEQSAQQFPDSFFSCNLYFHGGII
jgi:hypothetical protein